MMEEGHNRVKGSYRDNSQRLAAAKAEYDSPTDFAVLAKKS